MSLESDLLLDRRRLKRRLSFWRGFSVLAVLAAVLAVVLRFGGIEWPHVARLTVSGIITDDRKLVAQVRDLADDDAVKALLVEIDSPGGSVAGGEDLHDAIAAVAAKKPVVAVMGGLAASAGYMIAVPATRIFARPGTLTGSIGVLLESGDIAGLLARVGITPETIVSGPLKDQPSLTHPLSPQGREVLQGLVMDMYAQFVGMVAEGRHMEEARVRELADGRAYTGRQALALGLVDQMGGEAEARDWLAHDRGVARRLPVEDVETKSLAERTIGATLGPLFQAAVKTIAWQGLRLDGAWAIWQPSGAGEQ
jgi:protease-4